MCCGSKSRLGGFVSRVRRSPGRRVLMNAAALLVAAVFTAPIAVLALGSLRRPGQPPPNGLELLPERTTTGNYATAVRMGDLAGQLGNSLLIVAVAVPATVLVASWAGFAIATARRRTRRLLIGFSLVCLMVPVSALWVPRFVMFEWAGILDTFVPLMLPALMATSPFYVLLFALEPTLHPILLAASVVVTLPGVIAFFLAQRTFLTKTIGP